MPRGILTARAWGCKVWRKPCPAEGTRTGRGGLGAGDEQDRRACQSEQKSRYPTI